MNKMTLGGYTFARNPNKSTEPKQYRSTSVVPTYGGAAFFSWGMFIEGLEVTLEWDYMTEAMFEQLQSLLDDDESKVWDPQTGSTYNVQMLTLEGEYLTTSLLDAEWRQNVKLTMVIMSEV